MYNIINVNDILKGLYIKTEYNNPSLCMKHRCIPRIIKDMYDSKSIKSVGIITAGCAGISTAWMANMLNIDAIVYMPYGSSTNLKNYIESMNAEVVLFDPKESHERPECDFFIDQMNNNGLIDHYKPVAEEILKSNINIDCVIASVGSGASIMALSQILRPKGIKIVAVHAKETKECWKPHGIQGISPPLKSNIIDYNNIDHIEYVSTEEAMLMSKKILKIYGEPVGISSGATVIAAEKVRKVFKYKNILSICASHLSVSI